MVKSAINDYHHIVKRLSQGTPRTTIAKEMGVMIEGVERKRRLLNNINPAAVSALQEKLTSNLCSILRQVTFKRQQEMCAAMADAGTYSPTFGMVLLALTPTHQLRESKNKVQLDISLREKSKMYRAMEAIDKNYASIKEEYVANQIRDVLAKAFVSNLMSKSRIAKHIRDAQPEIYRLFRKLEKSSIKEDKFADHVSE